MTLDDIDHQTVIKISSLYTVRASALFQKTISKSSPAWVEGTNSVGMPLSIFSCFRRLPGRHYSLATSRLIFPFSCQNASTGFVFACCRAVARWCAV